MTANRIKQVALKHFANHGYEGASLADIAAEVGIKTPSIYAHFKGKDDLFLQVIQDIAEEELSFLKRSFQEHKDQSFKTSLYQVLVSYKERYEQDLQMKFWLRMSFFPPLHVKEQVDRYVMEYLDRAEQLLVTVFASAIESGVIARVGAERATIAYMAMMDSIFVEMLYGGEERSQKRLEAAWAIFWRGVVASDEQGGTE
ncbi:TetR/AcrR family transcriptional regulator [Tumebacillus lipolyticus]|uniref:TetR/AcrR family transcriptional regulator n=1 Tax=Tumebacillus lipolyticus TaxID=1280370 RepID=A0ABW4ZTW8_9BACL